eukprot:scaffold18907_cov33-Tisochrysis_lutea.AAC.5
MGRTLLAMASHVRGTVDCFPTSIPLLHPVSCGMVATCLCAATVNVFCPGRWRLVRAMTWRAHGPITSHGPR